MPQASDVANFTGNQVLVFLGELDQEDALTPERAQLLGKVYDFVSSQNVEIKVAYYTVALKAKDHSCVNGIAELLGTVGRMKFVRVMFRGLEKANRELALETFAKHSDFYHPICRGMVQKDLKL